ncbi:hypothetical protein F511_31098 [Dorcoceras hygrometricum]|uniref:Uncharacterized protein n=1 Tax=Dorcoceras hygrometricum TaxID=472368 RepID=A0A2Z7B879_9LAMI|nr:hypothetical protein F511_31098 [Dorcoceras hygrometricum]
MLNKKLTTANVPSKHDDVKLVYVVSHTVAACVHLWSLGVLTAAGCGIGSVHKLPRAEKSKSYFRRPKRRNLAKNGGAHKVSFARWTVSEGTAQASCENVIWNRIYEVCWKKCRRKKMNSRCLESVAQDLVSAMMTSAYLLEKATSSNVDVSIAD